MDLMSASRNQHVARQGVVIPDPDSVYIGPEVDPQRIAPGVVLHPGCRIEGTLTSIGPGSVIGSEGPSVVRDCQLGQAVTLGSGFFEGSVLLDGASMGGGAHVRPGCLLEEQASGAHTVGLKQTVLMSYVTLGSLINFCDCLMSGGTSRKNHSEVGSSYIHFNFTPHQDKATPSLIGDVARGVLLDQSPIFLGGQGGLVGPSRIAFGSIVAAGQVVRHDLLEPDHLMVAPTPAPGARAYDARAYGAIHRIVVNNLHYIGNINALTAWYRVVRKPFMTTDTFSSACFEGALRVFALVRDERIKRLGELAGKMPESIARLGNPTDERTREIIRQQQRLSSSWSEMQVHLTRTEVSQLPELEALVALCQPGTTYLDWVQSRGHDEKTVICSRLEQIVLATTSLWNT
jgi:UDP-N-acetylglucosamine/UDP-N-acetylgalactosamine diphosphorylase